MADPPRTLLFSL